MGKLNNGQLMRELDHHFGTGRNPLGFALVCSIV